MSKVSDILARSGYRLIGIGILAILLAGCSPRVATSFWKIGTEADSDMPGYTVIHAEGKTRHCYPIDGWYDVPEQDTYHQLHHHGVAVESELMAYRIYFDKKQTIDVYCKRTPRLELAQSYWYPNDSLLAAGYGDDILRVGGTVGVGTVKYWNGKLQHIEEVGERQQWIVSQTRRKATIAVGDVDWTIPDSRQDLPETRKMTSLRADYTIRAGHRDMRCDVFVTDPVEGLCTGVQLLPGNAELIEETDRGVLLASWGTDWPVNDSVKYAKETVGLAVFIPKPFAGRPVHDSRNNLCLLKVKSRSGSGAGKESKVGTQEWGEYTCHFYLTCVSATKENHPVATSAAEWYEYVRRWAKKLK